MNIIEKVIENNIINDLDDDNKTHEIIDISMNINNLD
jgi:hypothetical protein